MRRFMLYGIQGIGGNSVGKRFPLANSSLSIGLRSIFVQTQTTPNPHSLKFLPGETVMGNGNSVELTKRDVHRSPLARRLFQIEGISGLYYGPDFISINKEEESDWEDLKPQIYASIMDHYQTNEKLLVDTSPASDTLVTEEDDETTALIKEILETRVRPSVQEDGGDIEYIGFVDGVVLLKMKGACKGCGSSSITLKNGVERLLQHWVAEVKSVMAVDDDDLEKLNLNQFLETEKKIQEKHEAQAGDSVKEKST